MEGSVLQGAPYLSLRGVTARFGSFVALQDVHLDVEEGEFVCFLGPSGCGKTTLLRAIAGLTPQSEGQIWQAGREISHLPVTERDFGIVFQSYALFPNLTVARNVAYGLEARGGLSSVQRRRRVGELLELVDLATSAGKYPAQLSGGQQQRVALARALATSPGLLLLDEPLSALDARVRQRLRLEIKQLQQRIGVTTIMVTHDQEEALTMADRIVVMNDGRIAQVGTPLTIYTRPSSAFVADFVGTMNLFPATTLDKGRVAVGNRVVKCGNVPAGLPTGSDITVCLRPEDVVLPTSPKGDDGCHVGKVVALEFLGSTYRALLEAGDGFRLLVDLPARSTLERAIEIGSMIPFLLPPERLRVLA